uniref:Neuron navigator 2 n=1 Tax=Rousettus aegyptiacus TaxID=9407 RepID=A0A7J8H3C3_ROUAE|nr:neuron navigator 2 [Rousettus aegyptiacus]
MDSEAETVMQLRNELRDKEMKLTDIRLEALSSAHQLDQLREAMNRMQSEIEKLKAENDRLKSESQGTGCSRAPSQVSLSASPRQSMGLSQHSLNLTESTSLGEWCHRAAGQGPQPALRSLIQSPKISRSTDQMERRQACVHLGCVCVWVCVCYQHEPNRKTAVMLRSSTPSSPSHELESPRPPC